MGIGSPIFVNSSDFKWTPSAKIAAGSRFLSSLMLNVLLGFLRGLYLVLSFEGYSSLFLFCLNFSVFLYEIRWTTYLSWSWRHIVMCECPYAVCMCPVALLGGPGLKWAQARSCPKVYWQLPPWWKVMLDLEGIGLEPGVSQGSSWAPWKSASYGGRARA